MQTSLFIAKLLGPVFLVMGLVVLFDAGRFKTIAREFLQGEAFIFLSGLITLPLGLAIVNTHNVWTWDWRLAITLFGWLGVFAGILRLTLGGQLRSFGASMIDNQVVMRAVGALMSVLGAWLCWIAYLS